MMRLRQAMVIVFGVAAVLVWLHGHHPGFGPLGWANAGGRVGFMAHMIELKVRRVVAAVGTVVTIR